MAIEVRVPALGESVTEATVATWFKKPGDAVAADEMLCELETDKVTVEVPSPAAGRLGEIVAAEGLHGGPNALLATSTRARARPRAAGRAGRRARVAPDVATVPQDSPATHARPRGRPLGPRELRPRAHDARPSRGPRDRRSDVEDAPSAKKLMADNSLRATRCPGTGATAA
jgi:2-oxoglutarate dehydrogenase E2 component (dihydrolipoamide succinyltransferase)